MGMSDGDSSLSNLFLGRQPILDSRQVLIGYELLFRDSGANHAPAVTAPAVATADVVCKAFTDLGLASALDGHKSFLIVDAEFLRHEAAELLPHDGVVLEIDAALAGLADVVERCRQLVDNGYAFCLSLRDLAFTEADASPLFDLISFIKLNIRILPDEMLKRWLAFAHERRWITIASHVESQDDYRRASALDFQFFQGYYFAEPTLVAGRKLDPALHGLVRIINLISQDAELPVLEQAFKAEAALTVKLLRLTNSVGVGLRTRISSVRQAINIVGRRPLQRWLQLLLFSHGGGAEEFERNPLMQLAALKGNFMERLARRCFARQEAAMSDLAFLAGMMSLMPAALGMPMAEILDQIAVAVPLRQALLLREGELGRLLELTDRYDANDLSGVDKMLAELGSGASREILNQCLAESIAWVQALVTEQE
jgi:EAL and modified HD-GYP domain-containing signal transduction protein